MQNLKKTIKASKDYPRLDAFLASEIPEISRSTITKLIKRGDIKLNNSVVKPKNVVMNGDKVVIDYEKRISPSGAEIIHEEDGFLIVNKPSGVLSIGTGGLDEETTIQSEFGTPDIERAGIVHRLDRLTSGLMLIAKTPEYYEHLKLQFSDRLIKKHYIALVEGAVEQDGSVDAPIARNPKKPAAMRVAADGKSAKTNYSIAKKFDYFTLLDVYPETGRTHQIRVHLQTIGHTIVGDKLYGAKQYLGLHRFFLHAHSIEFVALDGIVHNYEIDMPDELQNVINKLQ